jgi:mannose-6-phosphate isomerase-like protein (cupin superfamily)
MEDNLDFYNKFKKYNLKKVKTSKPGILNYTDITEDFKVERIFTITNFEDLNDTNNKRGFHYNINFDEIFIINKGEIYLEITNKTNQKITFNLKENDIFFFPRDYWLVFTILNKETLLTILCNKNLEESKNDYSFDNYIKSASI